MLTARQAALRALGSVRRNGVFATDALASACAGLDRRDRALAERLCLGVLQNERYLDFCIGRLTPLSKLEPRVLDVLRLGACQLFCNDRIPASAAVNESVTLARRASPRAAGLVNAVLRRLAALEAPPEPPAGDRYAAVRFSFPDWLAERLTERLGQDGFAAFAEASNAPPPLTLHLNPLRPCSADGLLPVPHLPGAFVASDEAAALELVRAGHAVVADAGAALTVAALGPAGGERLWDVCAAPGGKSFLAAFATGGLSPILATDISDKKLADLRESAARLGLSGITATAGDGRDFCPDGLFDAVLCDVPCSGFGVLRRKPDIRRRSESDAAKLPGIQRAILDNAARFVRPGGRLVYTTCTVLSEENEHVCAGFLDSRPDFSRESFALPGRDAPNGELMLWPHLDGTDGFYICRMRKS